MKKFFTTILLFSSLFCKAQTDTVLTYTDVVIVENVSQTELYSRARSWIDNSFKNMKAVLSINDKETGELAGKGVMEFEIGYMGKDRYQVPVTIEFKMNIRVKDGKYKYQFTDFDIIRFWNDTYDFGIVRSEQGNQKFAATKKWNQAAYNEIKEQIDNQVKLMVSSLKARMQKNDGF